MSTNKIDPKDNASNQKNNNDGTADPNEQYKKAQENTEKQRKLAKNKKEGK